MENLKTLLIKYLCENARYSVSQLASMTGADETAVAAAIKELEDNGTIIKYYAIINSEKTEGDFVDALIEVKVKPQKLNGFDAFAEELCAYKEVQSLYLMSGAYDLALFIRGKNLNEVARFVSEKLSAIDGIIGCATHFILKKYKVEGQNTVIAGERERQIML